MLARHAGARIGKVIVLDAGVLRGVGARGLQAALRGRRFRRPRRHGKWLVAPTDGRTILLFHFGMTGSLSWAKAGESRHAHDRIVFVLERRELRYRDLRKLQGLRVLHSDAELERLLATLGPDALDISLPQFNERLRSRGRLKTRLADQTVIAGLGNLLIDEMCWRARVNPMRGTDHLGDAERMRLYRAMRRVLKDSLPVGRVPGYRSWLTGRRSEAGARCPRCNARLSRRKVGGRTTVWCPRCQKE